MRNRSASILILAVILSGCVQAAHLAPPEVRTVKLTVAIDASSSADDLFGRAQAWLARDHAETKITVSHVDKNKFRIVSKADMYCNATLGSGLRSMGLGVNTSRLTFNIDFQAKDGKVDITYDELDYYLQDMRYAATRLVQGPSNQNEVYLLYNECILPLHKNFVSSLNP